MAAFRFATFYAAMAGAGLVVELIFGTVGLIHFRNSWLVQAAAAGHDREHDRLKDVAAWAPAINPTRLCPTQPKRCSCKAVAAK
jgi:hypothetical protein